LGQKVLLLHVFVAAGTFTKPMPNDDTSTETLGSNDTGIHMQTQTDEVGGLMKYAVGIGPDTIIDTPSFIKIGSGIQNQIGGGTTWRSHKPTLGKSAKKER
jgi:hypothetical protein